MLETQIDVWLDGLEEDEEQLYSKIDLTMVDIEDNEDMFHALEDSMAPTSCGPHWSNLLQHLLLLPANPFQKYEFWGGYQNVEYRRIALTISHTR